MPMAVDGSRFRWHLQQLGIDLQRGLVRLHPPVHRPGSDHIMPSRQRACKDTELSIFTGTCGALTCVGWNDDSPCTGAVFTSSMDLNVVAGTSYYIQWDGRWDQDPFYWMLTECDELRSPARPIWTRTATAFATPTRWSCPSCYRCDPGAVMHYASGRSLFLLQRYRQLPDHRAHATAVPQHRALVPELSGEHAGHVDHRNESAFQPIPGIYDGTVALWGWNP